MKVLCTTTAGALRERGFVVHPFDEVLDRADEQKELMRQAMATGDHELAERAIAMGFGLISPRAALPRLEQAVSDTGPDLIVRDPAEFASMLLAERDGVPTVGAAGGLQAALSYFTGLVDEHVQALRSEIAVAPREAVRSDELILTATPPSFDVQEDPSVRVLRYRLAVPLTPLPTDAPPQVYATLGTAVMREPRGAVVLEAIVGALARLDI